jgi:hypothetical protein
MLSNRRVFVAQDMEDLHSVLQTAPRMLESGSNIAPQGMGDLHSVLHTAQRMLENKRVDAAQVMAGALSA